MLPDNIELDYVLDCVEDNLLWFKNSGVMIPQDGTWGVAERVVLTKGNSALDTMKSRFPAWTEHGDHIVLEQRRADCNFEAAWLFLRAGEILKMEVYTEIGRNILDFLYFRSGLLERDSRSLPGSWNWSHIKRSSDIWFDDESWCIFFPLEIARRFPELAARYECRKWSLILGYELLDAALSALPEGTKALPKEGHWQARGWLGNLEQPHWGSLAQLAMARCYFETSDPRFLDYILRYHQYVTAVKEKWNTSEQCYALLGEIISYRFTQKRGLLATAKSIARLLIAKMDKGGNLPAEHNEAPMGARLVDTIYTMNWAFMAFEELTTLTPSGEFTHAFEKIFSLLLKIQDRKSSAPYLRGAWRGMYDLEAGQWGGGDCYEGGSSSLYTGWTNAPIAATMLKALLS